MGLPGCVFPGCVLPGFGFPGCVIPGCVLAPHACHACEVRSIIMFQSFKNIWICMTFLGNVVSQWILVVLIMDKVMLLVICVRL